MLEQRVDHRVPDEVHRLGGDSLARQVLARLGGVREEDVAEMVGQLAVVLLGHGAVEAAQP